MRIKELRIAAGLKQSELANLLGVNQSAVANWESGNRWPLASKLPAIAAALGCTISDLYEPGEQEVEA